MADIKFSSEEITKVQSELNEHTEAMENATGMSGMGVGQMRYLLTLLLRERGYTKSKTFK